MTAVLSPSDLTALDQLPSKGKPLPGGHPRTTSPTVVEDVLIGGRVIQLDGEALILSDASAQVRLELGDQDWSREAPSPGDLLVLRVRRPANNADNTNNAKARQSDGWTIIELVSHRPCPEPRGDGEWMRLSTENRGSILRHRSQARRAIRAYFEGEGFVEVETPTFVPCPGLDPHVHSLAPVSWADQHYHLITSPELHMKRLLTAGMPRIYQFARCFRGEELGRWHEPEFTLLEWYRAFAGMEAMLEDTERVVRAVFDSVDPQLSKRLLGSERFLRMTVDDAFRRWVFEDDSVGHDAIALSQSDEERYFELLTEKVEPGIKALGRPLFLTKFPLSQAALARPDPDNPRVADRFELYVGGVEISNGYAELTDPVEQRARFERELARRSSSGEPLYPLDERFLQALEEGMPEASGNALGLDRLLALATGASSLKSTLAFAHDER